MLNHWNNKECIKANQQKLSTIFFSLFSSWLLAFLFQGQVLYELTNKYNIDPYILILGVMGVHFLGLFLGGLFVKNIENARDIIVFSMAISIIGSIPFFFIPSILWNFAIITISFFAGTCVASWGYYFKKFTYSNERIKTAANVLIFSNILMIFINMVSIHISPYTGLAISIFMVVVALIITLKLPVNMVGDMEWSYLENRKVIRITKPLGILCLFIVVITINSGLMYQVINPEFQHHQWLVSWYWALPYVAMLYVIKKLPPKVNRSYMLYVAIGMIGFAFLFFMIFDRSVLSYLIINTLMLGACGIYDLFWWSILGELLDYSNNPGKVFGIGLSSNVLGVFLGTIFGKIMNVKDVPNQNASILALGVAFLTFIMLPVLHNQLLIFLKNHIFLRTLIEMPPSEQQSTIDKFGISYKLTEREKEISSLLLRGRTYKMIANELYLSENTVKTHIKNIYSKFNVSSKTELINFLMEKENS